MVRLIAIFALVALLTGLYMLRADVGKLFTLNQATKNELLSDAYVKRIFMASGKFDPSAKKAVWFNKEVPLPSLSVAEKLSNAPQQVIGDVTQEKWIEVDLTSQTLYAHEGNNIVHRFLISSGLPWMPTVTGEFHIWAKILSQRMSGGSLADGTYYDLPNVPFIQYFYQAYGIHGAYWHTDFGHPRSHGCINMSVDDARTLFAWTNPVVGPNQGGLFNIDPKDSTRVVVHGTTPVNLN